MTTNLLPLLSRLHLAAPEMCQKRHTPTGDYYIIGEYRFWSVAPDNLCGQLSDHFSDIVTGRPALAWLADAIMAECERRGWHVATKTAYLDKHVAEVYNQSACRDTLAEALLTALVAAVEAERVTKARKCIECGIETTSGNICDECSRDAGHFR